MRIVHVAKGYPPDLGGMETHVQDVAQMALSQHQVSVIADAPGKETVRETVNGVDVLRLGRTATIASQPLNLGLVRAIRESEADLIHFHAPNPWGALSILISGTRAPIVITHHADILGKEPLRTLVMPVYRALCHKSAAMIFTARNNLIYSQDIPQSMKSDPKSQIIPLWLIPEAIEAVQGVDRAMERLGAIRPKTSGLGVFVGRMVPYKGLHVAIEALTYVPDFGILAIGDGPLRTSLEAKAEELGVAERIHFLGSVCDAEKIAALRLSDMLLLPSMSAAEAFGIVQMEAMLWGKPVIASDIKSGVTNVCVNEETGLTFPTGDPVAMASQIERLMTDRSFLQTLGNNARSRLLQSNTPSVIQDSMMHLYDRVLSGSLGLS